MVLVLARRDVEDLLDLERATESIEQAFVEQGHGNVTAWPRYLIRTGSAYLRAYSGGLGELGRMAFRINAGPPERTAIALLFDAADGQLLSLLAYPFFELRLVATVAVGLKSLATPGPHHVAMLGTGGNARSVLRALASVLDVTELRVFSPTPGHRRQFAANAEEVVGRATSFDSAAEAVKGANTVVVLTNSMSPVLYGDWLDRGALVVSAGMRQELDDSVFLQAELIVTTSKVHEDNVHERQDDWPLVRLRAAGLLDWAEVKELGSVVTGEVKRPSGITVFSEAYGGFTDVALAAYLYERANELGRGVEVDMS